MRPPPLARACTATSRRCHYGPASRPG
jgi:hypothetical protein